jgi:integrase
MTKATAFSSLLAPIFKRYVNLKRVLGRRFAEPTRTLQSLDRFLHDEANRYPDLNANAFRAWRQTQEGLASGTRRDRMMDIYRFCLYRRRTEPQCFLPDPDTFPQRHQPLIPYIFSEAEVARLLRAAASLTRPPSSPLRPEVIRLAIVLLFTTGIRRGELLRLRLSDYNRQDSTLLIRESKFHKSRLLPINGGIAGEIESYLRARKRHRLPVSADVAFIWNSVQGGRAYNGPGLQMCLRPLLRQCGILTSKGKLPRIHDARHNSGTRIIPSTDRQGGLLREDRAIADATIAA